MQIARLRTPAQSQCFHVSFKFSFNISEKAAQQVNPMLYSCSTRTYATSTLKHVYRQDRQARRGNHHFYATPNWWQ